MGLQIKQKGMIILGKITRQELSNGVRSELDKSGDLSLLETTEKGTLVGAINEVDGDLTTHLADYIDKSPDNAYAHNSIYRGKYLGTSYTAAQQVAVSAGTFEDLYIGDYWTIGGINYRIAAFNYFRNVGDTNFTTNHITIVPDTQLYTARMNETNTTVGGYTGSEMRTTNLSTAITTINNAFPSRVVTHRQILVNAAASGVASGWAWTGSSVELMNEVMVYGTGAWGVSSIGNGYNVASSNGRLPLFVFRQDLVNNRQSYWLRDVASATAFALVRSYGYASYNVASYVSGVRPAFSIS